MEEWHKLLMQALVTRPAMPAKEAKELCKQAASAYKVRWSGDLAGTLVLLNAQLRPLGLEAARAHLEDTGEEWYGLVNRSCDSAAKILGSQYPPAELELFNKLVLHMMGEGEGSASSTVLINMAATGERKLTHQAAQTFLHSLVHQHWLCETSKGVYGPGPRFVLELRPFLQEVLGEERVPSCHFCNNPVIKGQQCLNCNTTIHIYCMKTYAKRREDVRCPKCHCEWVQGFGDSEESGSGSVGSGPTDDNEEEEEEEEEEEDQEEASQFAPREVKIARPRKKHSKRT